MGFLDTLEQKQIATPAGMFWEDWPATSPMPVLSTTGLRVDHDNAISSTAVWAALTIIAGTIGTLPLKTYRRTGPDARESAPGHPTNDVVQHRANRWMTAGAFREAQQGHLLLRGNSFAQILRDRLDRVRELIPLHPSLISVAIAKDGLVYEYQDPDRGLLTLKGRDVLHVLGFSANGIVGYDPIAILRDAIALAMAAERHGSRFFEVGGRGPGILHTELKLDPKSKGEMSEAWGEKFRANPFGVAVLDQGLKWEAMGFSAEEAQFIETRKFQISEIARIFNIQPHLLKDLERATFSNIEQQALEFEKHTIRPWLRRWEQALAVRLLTEEERETYFFKFTVEDLLAADIQTRFAAYATGIQNSWTTVNEVRKLEDLNPFPDGDQRYILSTLVKVTDEEEESEEDVPDEEPEEEEPGPEFVLEVAGESVDIDFRAQNGRGIKMDESELEEAAFKAAFNTYCAGVVSEMSNKLLYATEDYLALNYKHRPWAMKGIADEMGEIVFAELRRRDIKRDSGHPSPEDIEEARFRIQRLGDYWQREGGRLTELITRPFLKLHGAAVDTTPRGIIE